MRPSLIPLPLALLLAPGCLPALPEGKPVNSPPGTPQVALNPGAPSTSDDIAVLFLAETSDPDAADTVTHSYQWFQDGTLRPDLTSDTVPASETTKGETWKVVVVPNDGKLDGTAAEASATVVNTPPVATVTLAADPATDADLVAEVTSEDADADTVTYTYVWTRDGETEQTTEGTIAASDTVHGETWTVTVTPNDGEAVGEPVTASVVVANSAPGVESVELAPSPAYEDSVLTATASGVDDLDDDGVTLTYTWFVNDTDVQSGEDDSLTGALFDKHDLVRVEVTPTDGFVDGAAVASDDLLIENTLPSGTSVSVVSSSADGAAYEASTLTCAPAGWADADGDAEGWTYAWQVGGAEVSTAASLDGALFSKGDVVACTATPTDGEASGAPVTSATLTIANTAPVLASVALSTTAPTESDTVSVTLGTASDDDGDAVAVTYAWFVDGVSVGTGSTLPASSFHKGDSLYVVVTPWDGSAWGAPVTSAVATAVNTQPTVASVTLSPSAVYTDDTLTASVSASDLDGDILSHTYAWYVEGDLVQSGASATLSGAAHFDRDEEVYVVVTPNDGEADGSISTSSTVTVLNSAPTAPGVEITPDDAGEGDDLTCAVVTESSDADGDALTYTFAWDADGVDYTGATDSATESVVAGADVGGSEEWTCEVRAADTEGEVATASTSVQTGPAGDCTSFRFTTEGTYFSASATSGYTLTYSTGNTIEFWVYPEAGGGGQVVGSRTGDLPSWSIRYTGSNINFQHGTNNYTYLSVSGAAMTANTWNHVAFVRSDSFTTIWKVFVNGIDTTTLVSNGTVDRADLTFPFGLHVGGQPGYSGTMEGAIASLQLSNTARYTTNFTPPSVLVPDASTLLYYDFSEGSGTTAHEGTGTGYDLTISTGTWLSSGPDCP